MEGAEPPVAPEVRERVDRAFELEARAKEALTKGRAAAWELAETLHEIHETGAWTLLGYESLGEFLAQPELGIRRTQFFRLTKIWRDLVVVRGVPAPGLRELEPSKVDAVVPAIMRGDASIEDALSDVRTLGFRDLREKYRPGADRDAPLDAEAEPERARCESCGSWLTPEALREWGEGGGAS